MGSLSTLDSTTAPSDSQLSSLTLGLSNAEDAVQDGSDWTLWSLALF